MGWTGYVARVGRAVYRFYVDKPVGKRPLRRPRPRKKDNIKMDLQDVGCGAMTRLIRLRIGRGSWVS
jgi:hypothetical protein